MSIAAGRLRHRVSLQRNEPTQDQSTGEILDKWVEYAKVWASVEPLSAREFISAAATQSKITTRITIRYMDGVDASMRIVHTKRGAQRVFNIEGVLSDRESGLEYLTLPCSEGVSINGT